MTDTRVSRARAAEKLLRAKFEIAKEEEWQTLSRAARAEVEHAVWEAALSGLSTAQIAREYGTTNRGTIYAIIRRLSILENA